MSIFCPKCNQELSLDAIEEGRHYQCPTCEARFVVRSGETELLPDWDSAKASRIDNPEMSASQEADVSNQGERHANGIPDLMISKVRACWDWAKPLLLKASLFVARVVRARFVWVRNWTCANWQAGRNGRIKVVVAGAVVFIGIGTIFSGGSSSNVPCENISSDNEYLRESAIDTTSEQDYKSQKNDPVAPVERAHARSGGLLSRANKQDSDVASAYGETWNSFYGLDAYKTLLKATLDTRSDGAPSIVADAQIGKLTVTIRLSVNESAYNEWKVAAFQRLESSGLRFRIVSPDVLGGRMIGGRNYLFEENDEAAIKRWEERHADRRTRERAEKALRVIVRLVNANEKVIRESDVLLEKFQRKNAPYDARRPFYGLNRLRDLPEPRFDWKGLRGGLRRGGNPDEDALAEVDFTGLTAAEMDSLEDVKCEVRALEVFDRDKYTQRGITYCYQEKTRSWEVESCEKELTGEVMVLSALKGYKVAKINQMALANQNSITKVVVGDGIEIIERGAFCRCPQLLVVSLPNSVTNLEREAFSICPKLSRVKLPQGLTRIEGGMFSGCTELREIAIPAGVGMIEDRAFSSCRSLTEVSIPSGVARIGEDSFKDCRGLQRVTLPAGLRCIGKEAFRDCAHLTLVAVSGEPPKSFAQENSDAIQRHTWCSSRPGVWTGVGEYAFRDCVALTEVTIPGGVKEIGNSVFCDCEALERVTLMPGFERIGKMAFHHLRHLASVKIPSTMKEIADSAFSGCEALTDVALPNGLEILGNGVFSSCRSISDLAIPASVKSIGHAAFSGCSKLTKVVVPAQIDDYKGAFLGANGLTEVALADGVKRIPWAAFSNCGNLTRVSIPASVKTIDNGAFDGCFKLSQVTLPASVTEIGNNAFPKDTKIIRK